MLQKIKKILIADPEIQASIILGHNCVKIAHVAQIVIFFGKSLSPVMPQRKKILGMDPEIQACIILDPNWVRINHLAQK